MDAVRTPFQGVLNIVRFNWHFYIISGVGAFGLIMIGFFTRGFFEEFSIYLVALIFLGNFISLFASWYIYDQSPLYTLNWLEIGASENAHILNIHAGFDETSVLLKRKYPTSNLMVFDFYDPIKHTEVSIKRARKAYPPYSGTISVKTNALPVKDQTFDFIFLTMAAHEIRDIHERNMFFDELKRILNPNGKIILTEHLQDLPNFLVYSIGFRHFLTRRSWENNFIHADLVCSKEVKITPFITSFMLQKNGITN